MENTQTKVFYYHRNHSTQLFESLEEIIFGLNEANISDSVKTTMDLIDDKFFVYYNLALTRLIYSSLISQMKDCNIYINFMKEIEIKEKEINKKGNLLKTFTSFLLHSFTKESKFFLEKMIELHLISPNLVHKNCFYFAHYMTDEEIQSLIDYGSQYWTYFSRNYEELSKNDFELHKQLIKEGVNPNEIAKIIRNDDIEKLQEISSQENFDFNQTIEPSLYERCSFINKVNVSLIDYAAFFSSVKCFKYLLMNGAKVENTGKYAIAGGNIEIVHLCEQNHSLFEDAYKTAIMFHRNDIFKYLYENKTSKLVMDEVIKLFFPLNLTINIKIFNFLLEQEGIDINTRDKCGWTLLMEAIRWNFVEIPNLLLEQKGININSKNFIQKNFIFLIQHLY